MKFDKRKHNSSRRGETSTLRTGPCSLTPSILAIQTTHIDEPQNISITSYYIQLVFYVKSSYSFL